MSAQEPTVLGANAPAKQPAPAEATPSARRAALLLHALPARDRDWLYGQLRDADRASVGALVAELESLGIPADPTLLHEVTGAGRAHSPSATHAVPPPPAAALPPDDARASTDPLLALGDADPDLLAAILHDEPAGLIAILLGLRDWPWRQPLLQRLDLPKRRQVEDQLGRAGHPGSQGGPSIPAPIVAADALREHLVAALLRRHSQLVERSRPRPGRGAPRNGTSLAARASRPRLPRLLGRGSRS